MSRSYRIPTLIAFLCSGIHLLAQTSLVVPPGFEKVEGDALTADFADGFRYQQLAQGDWFEALGAGTHLIEQLSFRPSADRSQSGIL